MKMRLSFVMIISSFLVISIIGCNQESASFKKRIINPVTWGDQYGFVQANEVTNAKRTLYLAGQVSVDEKGNLLYGGDMEKQMTQIFDNMERVLGAADFKLAHVVRFTYYTSDMQAFFKAEHILRERLKKADCKPASSLIGVKALYHPECLLEIAATVAD